MNSLSLWNPGDQVLIWGVNVLLQVTVVAAVALAIAASMRRSPAVRYWVLCSSLLLLLLIPVIGFVMQWSGSGVLPLSLTREAVGSGSDVAAVEFPANSQPVKRSSLPAPTEDAAHSLDLARSVGADGVGRNGDPRSSMEATSVSSASAPTASQDASAETPSTPQPTATWIGSVLRVAMPPLLLVWLAGALFLLVRLAIGWRRLATILRSACPNTNRLLSESFDGVGRALRVDRMPELVLSQRVSAPLAAGLFRPRVVLPERMVERVTPEQLRDILVHEAAHIVRRDQLVVLLQHLAATIFWLHPLTKALNRQLAQAREEVCDNYVLAATDAPSYSHTLLTLAELVQSARPLPGAVGLFTTRWKLERRVAGLLDEKRNQAVRPATPARIFVVMLSLVMIALITTGTLTSTVSQADAPLKGQSTPDVDRSRGDRTAESARSVEANRPTPAGYVSARGTVVDPSGAPRPGVRVLLRAASGPAHVGLIDFVDVIAETTTGSDGRFVFRRAAIPAEMDYVVEPLRSGKRGADVVALAEEHGISWAPLYSLDNSEEVNVTLNPAATLEGVVKAADGLVLADARVSVIAVARLDAPFDESGAGPSMLVVYCSSLRSETSTNGDGRFRIDGLPAECVMYLHVVHPEYQEQFLFAATTDDAATTILGRELGNTVNAPEIRPNPLEVSLASGLRVDVRVVDDETGRPFRQGRLALIRSNRESKTMLGPGGAATLTVAEPGEYTLYCLPADLDDRFGIRRNVSLTKAHASSPLDVAMRFPDRRTLKGRVVGEGTETGIGGVTVSWSKDSGETERPNSSYLSHAVTLPDGGFRLSTVPGTGTVSLRGEVEGFFIPSSGTLPGDVAQGLARTIAVPNDGKTEPLRLEVSRGLVVQGTVRAADGVAAPKATVQAASLGRFGPRLRQAISDEDGRYEIAGLNPREPYELTVAHDGALATRTVEPDESHPIEQTREWQVELTLQPAVTLRGRVLLGNRPLSGVRMKLQRGTRLDGNRVSYLSIDDATTGADGRYEVTGLRPGDLYHIDVQPPFPATDPTWVHQSPYRQTLPENAKREVDLPDVRLLRRTQTIAGVVVDPDGKPVSGATVSTSLQVGGGSLSRPPSGPPPWTETDKLGRFRLTQLPDAPLQLMAYISPKEPDRRIRFPARVKCERNQQDVRMILDPSLVEDD